MAQSRTPHPGANGTMENFCVLSVCVMSVHECKPVYCVCECVRERENRMVEE